MKKNLVLIGGSHGIGLSIATQLHNAHSLYILSRTKDGLENINHTHLTFDVLEDEPDLGQLPEKIDGLVYCPGSINLKPLKRLEVTDFEQDMRLNFFGLVKVIKALESRFTEGSNLVFFSTVAVRVGMPFHTSVAAAKGAVEGFARALAAEYAPRLRVNVIAPSLVDTPLASKLLNSDKKAEMLAKRHPLQRVGNADEIADLAIYLLLQGKGWITGQVLGIDGGISTLNTN